MGQDSRDRPLAPRGPPERKGAVGLSGLLSAAPPSGGLRAADPGCAAREPGGWRRPQRPSCGRAPGRPAARGAPVPERRGQGRPADAPASVPRRRRSAECGREGAAPRTPALASAGLPGVWRLRSVRRRLVTVAVPRGW